MTDSTVSADLPQREPGEAFKFVGELERGDWIGRGQLGDQSRGPAEILHVERYVDDVESDRCHIVYRLGPDAEPVVCDLPPTSSLRIAAGIEVETTSRDRRRRGIGNRLRALADVIEQDGFPLPGDFDPVRVGIRMSSAVELDRVAELLGTSVAPGLTRSVVWPVDERRSSFLPVEAQWYAYAPDVADDPLGRLYSREQESTYVGTAPVPDHVDGVSMTGRGEPAGFVSRYFSFGHGQTDPDTGEDLLDKYVTVVAPTAEACREAMFASRYGNRWAFEYAPGTLQADEWISRWTEHERIVVDPADDPLFADIVAAVGSEPHPSWPTESELKPWESLDPAADRNAESVKRITSIDPDSSMEAHYDAEIEAGQ